MIYEQREVKPFLDRALLDGIHQAALDILARTGLRIEHDEIRAELAKRTGFKIDGQRVLVHPDRANAWGMSCEAENCDSNSLVRNAHRGHLSACSPIARPRRFYQPSPLRSTPRKHGRVRQPADAPSPRRQTPPPGSIRQLADFQPVPPPHAHNSPRKALSRMEGMRASRSAAVSCWRRLRASSLAWRPSR